MSKNSRKKQRISLEIESGILEYIERENFSPLEENALFAHLNFPQTFKEIFDNTITKLTKENKIFKTNGIISPNLQTTITGTIRVHPRGFGFLVPDDKVKEPKDLFIPPSLLNNAVDGDHVEAIKTGTSAKGPEGKIISILQRKRTHLAGTVLNKNKNIYTVYVPLLGKDRSALVQSKKTLNIGDRIMMKVQAWDEDVLCTLEEVIGNISDPSKDVAAAIAEYQLLSDFSKEAIEEAKSFGKIVKKKDYEGRVDLTKDDCITIDPETAKDFDDAISVKKSKKGYHLGVHIADVAHFVKQGSFLDKESTARGNSTYFPGECVPMLPHELSSNLCSLKPNVARLTMSVFMDFDLSGTLTNYKIEKSVIKSKKRLSYKEAFAILKGDKSPFQPLLKTMEELALLLKAKRFERGSIDFAIDEGVIQIDDEGNPLGLRIEKYDISHQMIEEFMLKANEIVARHLQSTGEMLIYRIHEHPTENSYEDFYTFARGLGFYLPPHPTNQDIQRIFQEAKETQFAKQLSLQFIRSMRLAHYSPENIGHYGLALEHYCHFTSPIRRYSDLVAQRLLFKEQEGDLQVIALICSEKERTSFQAETSVVLLKKLRLLQKMVNEDPYLILDALITGVKPFGIVFEIPSLFLEGFIHISEIGPDWYDFDERTLRLKGSSSGEVFAFGSEIKVKLIKIDLTYLETSWKISHPKKRKK